MSDITVISRQQRIIVEPASGSVSVVNLSAEGPPGPTGPEGPEGPTGPQGPQGVGRWQPHFLIGTNYKYGMPGRIIAGSPSGVALTAGRMYIWTMEVFSETIQIVSANLNVNTGATGTTNLARLAIYNMNMANGKPSSLVADLGTVAIGTTGSKTISGLTVNLAPGMYVVALLLSDNATLTKLNMDSPTSFCSKGLAISGSSFPDYPYITQTWDAAPNPAPSTITATDGTGPQEHVFALFEWNEV